MSTGVKSGASMGVMVNAVRLLAQLAEAGPAGVLASDLVIGTQDRQIAARWLRQQGMAVVATKARQESRWYLATDDAVLVEQWRLRITEEAYVEVCRAHMALVGDPAFARAARSLATTAMVIAERLSIDMAVVMADLNPEDVDPVLAAVAVHAAERYDDPEVADRLRRAVEDGI